ncbi:MAG: hypothetical protein M1831_001520 [Alyxoria varia]|nr:MAG: hypothetical protein M1831_001520 [Alyxoria varia]
MESSTNNKNNGINSNVESLTLVPPTFFKDSPYASYVSTALLAHLQGSDEVVGTEALGRGLVEPFDHLEKDAVLWRNKLTELFAVAFHYVRQIPVKHPCQLKLVTLFEFVRTLPPPAEGDIESVDDGVEWAGEKFWNSLPKLVTVFDKYELYGPAYPPRLHKGDNLKRLQKYLQVDPITWPEPLMLNDVEYANIHGFLAELWALAGEELGSVFRKADFWCLCALMDALEEEIPPPKPDQLLPAAAAWILCAGRRLREHRLYVTAYTKDTPDHEPGDRRYWSRESVGRGSDGSIMKDLDPKTRETAARAHAEMVRLDDEAGDDWFGGPLPWAD